jgi:hypothetical protein
LNNYDISLTSDPLIRRRICWLCGNRQNRGGIEGNAETGYPSELAVGYASEQILNTIGTRSSKPGDCLPWNMMNG